MAINTLVRKVNNLFVWTPQPSEEAVAAYGRFPDAIQGLGVNAVSEDRDIHGQPCVMLPIEIDPAIFENIPFYDQYYWVAKYAGSPEHNVPLEAAPLLPYMQKISEYQAALSKNFLNKSLQLHIHRFDVERGEPYHKESATHWHTDFMEAASYSEAQIYVASNDDPTEFQCDVQELPPDMKRDWESVAHFMNKNPDLIVRAAPCQVALSNSRSYHRARPVSTFTGTRTFVFLGYV